MISVRHYLPEYADSFAKLAGVLPATVAKKPDSQLKRTLQTAAKGALGIGLGTAAGFGIGAATDAIARGLSGKPSGIPEFKYIVPVLTAGMLVSKALWQAKEQEALRGRKDR
jgi:hypothetical protein